MENQEIAQLKVYVPEFNKIKFQAKCTENRSDMTKIVNKFISLYLSDNEALMPLLSD
jgi:hypothetical protein